jgi:hypothetical protein
MRTITTPSTVTQQVAALFEEKSPILVEVRFPGMGTSPDWYFCREEEEFESLQHRLGAGVIIHLHSVWDVAGTSSSMMIQL